MKKKESTDEEISNNLVLDPIEEGFGLQNGKPYRRNIFGSPLEMIFGYKAIKLDTEKLKIPFKMYDAEIIGFINLEHTTQLQETRQKIHDALEEIMVIKYELSSKQQKDVGLDIAIEEWFEQKQHNYEKDLKGCEIGFIIKRKHDTKLYINKNATHEMYTKEQASLFTALTALIGIDAAEYMLNEASKSRNGEPSTLEYIRLAFETSKTNEGKNHTVYLGLDTLLEDIIEYEACNRLCIPNTKVNCTEHNLAITTTSYN